MAHGEAQQAIVLVLIERVRLARGAGNDERLRATSDLVIEQTGISIEIKSAVAERRGEGADTAGEFLQVVPQGPYCTNAGDVTCGQKGWQVFSPQAPWFRSD